MRSSLYVFFHLLKKDLLSFKRDYPNKLLDSFILFFTWTTVFCYFLPQEGVHKGYPVFFIIGAIGSFGFVEIVGKIAVLLGDIEGDKTIFYSLILPIHSRLLFICIGLQWTITSILLSILLFPLGKILLLKEFDLSLISYPRLIFIYLTANIFFGYFSLWLTSIIKGLKNLTSLWLRYINPIWMFGSFFYSWEKAYALSPVFGTITLFNPMVYVLEGMRAAALGQEGYIPYWICASVLWGFIFACCSHGIYRFKKRLDCI